MGFDPCILAAWPPYQAISVVVYTEALHRYANSTGGTIHYFRISFAHPCDLMAHFSSCGSSVLTAVFVAAAQLLTAAVTLFVLKRRLLRGQRLAVRNRSELSVALYIMKAGF